MRINSIKIVNLFGLYNYEIPISESEHICLLTGPNGYGKTTILSIIDNLFKGYLFYFYKLPFDEIYVELSENNLISIIKRNISAQNSDSGDSPLTHDIEVKFEWESEDIVTSFVINNKIIRDALRALKVQLELSEHELNNLNSAVLSQKVMRSDSFYQTISKSSVKFQEFLLKSKSVSTSFISANRIYTEEKEGAEKQYRHYYYEEAISPIKKISKQLKHLLQRNKIAYFDTVQKIDINLIGSLLKSEVEYTQNEYESKIQGLSSKLDSLLQYGLIARINFEPYNKDYIRLLSAYLNEIDKKLAVYDNFLEKLELLSELIRNKGFADKRFTFSPDYGIRCHLVTGAPVDLDTLSSGEKHQIILLFNLIFEVPDNSTLLIDEPENSLHVTWQRQFTEDIFRISKGKDLQVLIATHSSRIVANAKEDAWDLFYLNKEYGNEE